MSKRKAPGRGYDPSKKSRNEQVASGQGSSRREDVEFGPFLSERQWGTLREDLSTDGNCWDYVSYKDACHTAYRSGEDGLLGFSDNQARLCSCLALWNTKDPILKERMFGLTGPQGNHGEDVKESYFYVSGTPDHKYSKAIYKYPQNAFPYDQLLEENKKRGKEDDEFELLDTGIFNKDEYWDVEVEYVKVSPKYIIMRYTIHNRSNKAAPLYILPQVWYRNTWMSGDTAQPEMKYQGENKVLCSHPQLGDYVFQAFPSESTSPKLIFTDNVTRKDGNTIDSSSAKGKINESIQYAKDAFHHYIVKGNKAAVKDNSGTKLGALYFTEVEGGGSVVIDCCLYHISEKESFQDVHSKEKRETIIKDSRESADDYYEKLLPAKLSKEEKNVAKQAYAGLCWCKQFYKYDVGALLKATEGSFQWNKDWGSAKPNHIISMPDTWEFPWFASWDTCFQMITFAEIDPEFAKSQLLLLLSDDYMHPSGQIPGCEFDLSDPNPPLHAWASLKVFREDGRQTGKFDYTFLKNIFNKLEKNHKWWLNTKQCPGGNLFTGGFLGLDNISCIDRSKPPENWVIEQVDATSWVALMSLNMAEIAVELADTSEKSTSQIYEQRAIYYLKCFEQIYQIINHSNQNIGLWDDEDGIYYDHIKPTDSNTAESPGVLRVQSLVGLSPLLASAIFNPRIVNKFLAFKKALVSVQENIGYDQNEDASYFVSLVNREKLRKLVNRIFASNQFLSDYGIRALSKEHKEKPCIFKLDGITYSAHYWPGESRSSMYGGNSNWRGPVWLCMNYILLEALEAHCKSSSMDAATQNLKKNIIDTYSSIANIFLTDSKNCRPCHGGSSLFQDNVNFQNLVLFYEYFHGDTGRGCGASHQTGWTALITTILKKIAENRDNH